MQPLDSLCGGQVTISLELMLPMPHILLMGGGIVQKPSQVVAKKGWNYSVQDTREAFTTEELYPEAIERSYSTVEVSFLVKLQTRSHAFLMFSSWSRLFRRPRQAPTVASTCRRSGCHLNGKAFPRIGAIGSRSKWKSFTESCIEVGIQTSTLDQVRCPIGLNIGAESPEETPLPSLPKSCQCTKILTFMLQIGESSEVILCHQWMSHGDA